MEKSNKRKNNLLRPFSALAIGLYFVILMPTCGHNKKSSEDFIAPSYQGDYDEGFSRGKEDYEIIFGSYGLADKNKDGRVSPLEEAITCNELGMDFSIQTNYEPIDPERVRRYIDTHTIQTPTEEEK